MKKKRRGVLFIILTAVFFIFFLNITFNKSELDNLNNGEVTVIGHAGSGFTSWIPFNAKPDNSLGAIKKAIENGAEGVEVDLQMTKDQKFVIYHDVKLDSKTDITGCISDLTLEEITDANYKVGAPFDWFQDEKVASLDQLIELFKNQETFPLLQLDIRSESECKNPKENGVWEKNMAFELIKKLGSSGAPIDKVLIITLSKGFAIHLDAMNNPYPVSFELVGEMEDGIDFALEYKMDAVTVKPRLLTKEVSKEIHDKGLKVITFGAKSKSGNKKLLELNPDIIQTNNVEALRELMEYE